MDKKIKRYQLNSVIAFFLIIIACQSQNKPDLYLYKNDGKIGLINSEGIIVLKANYSHIGKFKNGLAAVTVTSRAKNNYHKILDTKLGYINTEGKIVIPLKFQHINGENKDFSEGLAVVKLNNKYGYINTEGKLVIKPKYTAAYAFNEGHAVVELNDDYHNRLLIDKKGNVVFNFLDKYKQQVDSTATNILVSNYQLSDNKIAVYTFTKEGKTLSSVLDSTGKVLFTKQLAKIKPYKNNIAIAIKDKCKTGSDNCFMLIDHKGKILTKKLYYPLRRIKQNTFLAGDVFTRKKLIINNKEDVLLPKIEKGLQINFDDLSNNLEFIRVGKGGYGGYIDRNGELVIDIKYMSTSAFSEGLAFVKKLDNTVLCIDKEDNIIFKIDAKHEAHWSFPFSYKPYLIGTFKNGLATLFMIVDGNHKIVQVDTKGNFLKIKEE